MTQKWNYDPVCNRLFHILKHNHRIAAQFWHCWLQTHETRTTTNNYKRHASILPFCSLIPFCSETCRAWLDLPGQSCGWIWLAWSWVYWADQPTLQSALRTTAPFSWTPYEHSAHNSNMSRKYAITQRTNMCLQCCNAVGWAAGRASGL